VAGILACRIRRHLAARPNKPNLRQDLASTSETPGWKPGDTAAKDGRRYSNAIVAEIALIR
jgi:hypothetical protein